MASNEPKTALDHEIGGISVRKKRMKREIAVASFFIFIGLYVIYSSLSMSIWRKSVPEEGFLPFVLACILIGLSTILLIDAFRKEEQEESIAPEERRTPRKLIFYIMAISFYSLTFGLLGFPISTAASLIFSGVLKSGWPIPNLTT